MFKKLIYLVLIVLVLKGTASAELIGWWRFDEGSGNNTMDSSGNGFDILLPDTTTWEDRLFRGAVHFHGAGEGNVESFRYRLQWSSNLFDILNP